jgi:formate hydrogenlyase subunit 3/multisubunit Na+/H+ antiporter MnhD subunit
VTLLSFIKVLRYAFLGQLPAVLKTVRESPAIMAIAMVVLAVFCTGMGLLLIPGAREMILDPAVGALADGMDYAQAVLAQH